MKKIKKFALGLFLLGTIVFSSTSCNSDDSVENNKTTNYQSKESKFSPYDLAADPDFFKYVEINVEEFKLVRDTKKIAEIVKDDVVDEKELIELPKALGYYSMESFKKVQQSKLNHLKALEKKFNISKLKATFVTDAIFIAWDKLEVYSDDKDLCMRERRNCFGIVNGTALGAHFACAGLDLTIIAGLACHASVAAVQYFALDNCQIEYERCIKK